MRPAEPWSTAWMRDPRNHRAVSAAAHRVEERAVRAARDNPAAFIVIPRDPSDGGRPMRDDLDLIFTHCLAFAGGAGAVLLALWLVLK